jgi:hypothetical protein
MLSFSKIVLTRSCLAYTNKLDQTQHQWRFEAEGKSQYFPLGCKTTFRRFASDRVVEFHIKPVEQCISPIGKVIGLEPFITFVQWYPSDTCYPDRPGIEGFHILHSIPHFDFLNNDMYPPLDLEEGTTDGIKATIKEVNARWSIRTRNCQSMD